MKQMKQRIIISLFLILGVSHFGYGQNTFNRLSGALIKNELIQRIDSFLVANGRTQEIVEYRTEQIAGLVWENGLSSAIDYFGGFSLDLHRKPDFIQNNGVLLIFRLSENETIGAIIKDQEIYFWREEIIKFLHKVNSLEGEINFQNSVLPDGFERDTLFPRIVSSNSETYTARVSVIDISEDMTTRYTNPEHRILDNRSVISIASIRKDDYSPVVLLEAMFMDQEKKVEFIMLDKAGIISQGKFLLK